MLIKIQSRQFQKSLTYNRKRDLSKPFCITENLNVLDVLNAEVRLLTMVQKIKPTKKKRKKKKRTDESVNASGKNVSAPVPRFSPVYLQYLYFPFMVLGDENSTPRARTLSFIRTLILDNFNSISPASFSLSLSFLLFLSSSACLLMKIPFARNIFFTGGE